MPCRWTLTTPLATSGLRSCCGDDRRRHLPARLAAAISHPIGRTAHGVQGDGQARARSPREKRTRAPHRIQAPSGHLAASRARRKSPIVPHEQGDTKGCTVSRSILRRNHHPTEYQTCHKTPEQPPNQEAAITIIPGRNRGNHIIRRLRNTHRPRPRAQPVRWLPRTRPRSVRHRCIGERHDGDRGAPPGLHLHLPGPRLENGTRIPVIVTRLEAVISERPRQRHPRRRRTGSSRTSRTRGQQHTAHQQQPETPTHRRCPRSASIPVSSAQASSASIRRYSWSPRSGISGYFRSSRSMIPPPMPIVDAPASTTWTLVELAWRCADVPVSDGPVLSISRVPPACPARTPAGSSRHSRAHVRARRITP